MSNNTIKIVQALRSDIEFDPSFFMDDAVTTAREKAAERGMTVERDDVRYIGETDKPEQYGDVTGASFYLFEAEATHEGVNSNDL